MKKIPLTQGQFAIVDDADFLELSQFSWYAQKQRHGFYAVRCIRDEKGNQRTILMHREIMRTQDGFDTDHINNDKLDNRRENLRICTASQNMQNKDIRSDSTSGFKGVSWH